MLGEVDEQIGDEHDHSAARATSGNRLGEQVEHRDREQKAGGKRQDQIEGEQQRTPGPQPLPATLEDFLSEDGRHVRDRTGGINGSELRGRLEVGESVAQLGERHPEAPRRAGRGERVGDVMAGQPTERDRDAVDLDDPVLDRIDEITPRHWVVLELSSFQLESVERPRLHVGVILNITPDHLDRHGTFERYVDLKARAVEFAGADDFAVLNGRDEAIRGIAQRTRAKVVWFDEHRPLPPMPLPGRHNMENALAAAAVGRIAGLSDDAIDAAIGSFKGVEHRLELVGEWGGVRWYNDSKATNPDAGRVALSAFPNTPVVLIAGGYGSGFELGGWLADVLANVEAVVLIGASAGLLAEGLGNHPKVVRAAGLDEAVERAAELARPGGVVVLSPAYKSFDMFKDYEDRGRRFKAAVRARLGTPSAPGGRS